MPMSGHAVFDGPAVWLASEWATRRPGRANDIVIVGDSPSRRRFKDILQAAPLFFTPIIVAVDKLLP